MTEAKLQLNFFENLENTIKIGLAVYLTILIIGLIVSVTGLIAVASLLPSNGLFAVLLGVLILSSIFVLFYYSIGKIS